MDRIYVDPVFSPNSKGADGALGSLSVYQNKEPYAQDIFILIFFILWLSYKLFNFKDEDNISWIIHGLVIKLATSRIVTAF